MTTEQKDTSLTPLEVKRLRKAWLDGVAAHHGRYEDFGEAGECVSGQNRTYWEERAALRYPMPLVEVPREVEIPETWDVSRVHRFRITDGVMQTMTPGLTVWETYRHASQAAALASLLASPTVTVPADQVPQ